MGGGFYDDIVLVSKVVEHRGVCDAAGLGQTEQGGVFQSVFTKDVETEFQKLRLPLLIIILLNDLHLLNNQPVG